jgi:hypothetical protein
MELQTLKDNHNYVNKVITIINDADYNKLPNIFPSLDKFNELDTFLALLYEIVCDNSNKYFTHPSYEYRNSLRSLVNKHLNNNKWRYQATDIEPHLPQCEFKLLKPYLPNYVYNKLRPTQAKSLATLPTSLDAFSLQAFKAGIANVKTLHGIDAIKYIDNLPNPTDDQQRLIFNQYISAVYYKAKTKSQKLIETVVQLTNQAHAKYAPVISLTTSITDNVPTEFADNVHIDTYTYQALSRLYSIPISYKYAMVAPSQVYDHTTGVDKPKPLSNDDYLYCLDKLRICMFLTKKLPQIPYFKQARDQLIQVINDPQYSDYDKPDLALLATSAKQLQELVND